MWSTLIFSCCAHKFDSHRSPYIVIFSFYAHKFGFHRSPCILILSSCARKFGFHRSPCILIFSCCAHKYDLHYNPCTLVFAFRVYTWFVALTFCRCPNTLHNTFFVFFKKHSNNKKCLHFVHCFFSIFIRAIRPLKNISGHLK